MTDCSDDSMSIACSVDSIKNRHRGPHNGDVYPIVNNNFCKRNDARLS